MLSVEEAAPSNSSLTCITVQITNLYEQGKTLLEKLALIDKLEEKKQAFFSIMDAFIGKKKLKDALSNILHDVM